MDRLKINGSLARKALSDLEEKGQIKKVVGHSKLSIYSMCSLLFLHAWGFLEEDFGGWFVIFDGVLEIYSIANKDVSKFIARAVTAAE